MLRQLDPALNAAGMIRAERILVRMSELLGTTAIENLAVPFTAVATDLSTGREVWFQKGPVDVAIRASIAIPGVIPPVMINGRLLADGGLINPIPIAATASTPADLVIAVSLAGERRNGPGIAPLRESAEQRPSNEWLDRFRRGAGQVLDNDMVATLVARFGVSRSTALESVAASAADLQEVLPRGLGKIDVLTLSFDVMQSVLTRYHLAGYPPDVTITIPKDACRTLDFHKAASLIELGRTLATEALDCAELTNG